jgi:amino acid transporter
LINNILFVVALGAVTGLTSSIIGSLFPLPRVLYSMASDGLLFSIFGKISNRSRTAIYSTIIGGFLAALMALIFDLLTLVEMLSIGTLIAYTQVALAVLISRYETKDDISNNLMKNLLSIIIIIFLLCFISIYSFEHHDYINPIAILIFIVLLYVLIFLTYKTFSKRKQNISDELESIFLTPFVPWLPIFSIGCNIYLMLKLSFITWIRFILWMIIGFSIYFFYGIQQAGKILSPILIFI